MINVIIFISNLIWFLPLYKQYKGSYFSFFLLLSIGDPLSLGCHFAGITPNYPMYAMILMQSIASFGRNKKSNLFIISYYSLAALPLIFNFHINIFSIILMLVMVINFSKRLLEEFFINRKINLFYTVLSFYVLLGIMNLSLVQLNLSFGAIYFYLTAVIMYLIALFFTFFNDKDDRIILSLNKKIDVKDSI